MNTKIERIYDEYADRLYRYSLMVLADHGEAENAVHQVFVKLMIMDKAVLRIESYNGYLIKAIRNECYRIIKECNRCKVLREKLSSVPIMYSSGEKDANEEERKILENAIRKLTPEQREVLHLKIYEGKTFSEIGELIGSSVNTAASRYRYAINKLREIIIHSNKDRYDYE